MHVLQDPDLDSGIEFRMGQFDTRHFVGRQIKGFHLRILVGRWERVRPCQGM
ncbi:MAG: hypothetical protein R6V46_13675 [Desulfatiglandaceae bacterium]